MSAERSLAYRWTPDDTEESIVGADWHQVVISTLRDGLGDVAQAQGWPWHIGNQMTFAAQIDTITRQAQDIAALRALVERLHDRG